MLDIVKPSSGQGSFWSLLAPDDLEFSGSKNSQLGLKLLLPQGAYGLITKSKQGPPELDIVPRVIWSTSNGSIADFTMITKNPLKISKG